MIKNFRLQLTEDDRRILKIVAAQSGTSMNQFVLDAIAEKIARLNAASKESGALAKALDKPA